MDDDDFSYWEDFNEGWTRIAIRRSALVAHVSEHEVLAMFREEIARQLREDEELRILVKEAVKSAIAGLNIGEIVALAVGEELKAQRTKTDLEAK